MAFIAATKRAAVIPHTGAETSLIRNLYRYRYRTEKDYFLSLYIFLFLSERVHKQSLCYMYTAELYTNLVDSYAI